MLLVKTVRSRRGGGGGGGGKKGRKGGGGSATAQTRGQGQTDGELATAALTFLGKGLFFLHLCLTFLGKGLISFFHVSPFCVRG